MTLTHDKPLRYGLPWQLNGLLAVLLLIVSCLATADEAQVSEYRVKTAFLYNFSRFVTWPGTLSQDQTEFSLCVIGTDPFGPQLDRLTGKAVHNSTLVVKRLQTLSADEDCELVYISKDSDLNSILSMVRGWPVLTVSDAENFIEQGGIIQFKLVDNKVRFRINIDAASAAGLNISSKLLSLALDVKGSY